MDNDIFDIVNQYNWYYQSDGYAYNRKMNILLHRFIWILKFGDIPDDKEVEHKDQNGLNCQLSNLRLATHSENCRNKSKKINNTSGYIGVSKQVIKRECQDGVHIHKYWYCSWTDNLGKDRAKVFPFNNAGKVLAARFYDIMTSQFAGEYLGELNFQSLEEYQHILKEAILKDIESN